MDIEQVRTFLAVAANGSFIEAASRLFVTQSTVSARIQKLENDLRTSLFIRNRSGASLTPAGKRFLRHAKTLMLTVEQAKHDIGLPSHYRASLIVGARIALWDAGLLPEWIGRLRKQRPDISISNEISVEDDLMRRLIEGTLDIALMYTPQHSHGLKVEHLFDETLLLVGTDPDKNWPDENYVYVDWGPGFYAEHSNAFPEIGRPPLLANLGWLAIQLVLNNGGSCFLPKRMADPLIASKTLYLIPDAPHFNLPAYVVFSSNTDSEELQQALDILRQLILEKRG
jgi:DNA-binding transcriptional LysR family regulator